ncbi:MAG: LptA/OstA family protein [Acidobacteriaceae bacterium]
MSWTIERLRVAIVAVAAALLLIILGYFFYARWRTEHVAQDLPAHLGLHIQQSTRGFVLSKTEQGRTIFTLHASRAVALKADGNVLLHDVEIDVFNQAGKTDTIAGKDFQYDRNTQIVVSQGETHIMLHPPQTSSGADGKKTAPQVVRVTTHGLVFNQKTGLATCSGEVDFQIADARGRAIGAEYHSQDGHLLLQSQVVLTTEMKGQPAIVHARQALYDRSDDRVHLQQARYDSATPQGNQHGSAAMATVFLRPDGSAQRLDAQGAVELASARGATIRASSMRAILNGSSRPQHVHFIGNVQFAQNLPDQQTAGSANDAVFDFDSKGVAQRAIFDQAVRFQQQAEAAKTHLVRTLRSQHLDLHLTPLPTGQAQLQTADATGNAVFRSQSTVAGHAPQETRIAGQKLYARFRPGNRIEHLDGTGQTQVRTVALNGDIDASSGDALSVDFVPGAKSPAAKKAKGKLGKGSALAASTGAPAQTISRAIQTGHVVLQQTSRPSSGKSTVAQTSTATAQRADYVASTDMLTLTGEPVFRNPQMELTAHEMQVQRATGRMVATGAVQGTLRRSAATGQAAAGDGLFGGTQPVHIIAAKAVLLHDLQKAIFTGQARLWQGGDTVEAPAIELSQKMQALLAYAQGPCAQCVHSSFVGPPAKAQSAGAGTGPTGTVAKKPDASSAPSVPPAAAMPQMFRVLSQRLLYSDAERKATFTDHVEVIGTDDEMFATRADIFFSDAPPSIAAEKNPSSAPSDKQPQATVQRIVAMENVRLVQPGRHASGVRLVYTAADGLFVLTGDAGQQPKVVDAERGTVIGPVLTFASQQQAIIVGGTSAHATTTKTWVQKK